MSTTKSLAEALYSISASTARTVIDISPTCTLGRNYPIGTSSYGSARKSYATTRTMKASRLALVASKLLTGEISVLCGERSVYFEYKGQAFFYDGGNIILTTSTDNSYTAPLAALLLYSLLDVNSELEETSTVMGMVASEYASVGAVDSLLLAYLCDAFYEDTKACGIDSYVLDAMPGYKLREIQQAVNTRNIVLPQDYFPPIPSEMHSRFSKVFAHVELAPPTDPGSSKASPSGEAPWYEKAKNGDFDVGFECSPEQAVKIRRPEFLDEFIPNAAHKLLVEESFACLTAVADRISMGMDPVDAIADDYLNVILCGKPGTGKTTTAAALSATIGLPIYTVPVTKNTEEDVFQGMTKVQEGGFAFKSTPFLEAYKNGGIIVLEEFNLADPGLMQGCLGQAVEAPFVLYEDGYKEVHRHPMCVIIGTMNIGTQGSREPNEAFSSRFPLTITIDDPEKDAFLSILEKKGYGKKECKAVYSAYTSILDYLKEEAGSEELAMAVSLRHCLGALRLLKRGVSYNDAIFNTMIGAIRLRDPILADEVYEACVTSKRSPL